MKSPRILHNFFNENRTQMSGGIASLHRAVSLLHGRKSGDLFPDRRKEHRKLLLALVRGCGGLGSTLRITIFCQVSEKNNKRVFLFS
jgi:hypothetical protein